MAQTLSFSPLSLDLPSSRMSIDFSTFAPPPPKKSVDLRTTRLAHQLLQHNTVPRRPLARPIPPPVLEEGPGAARNTFAEKPPRTQFRRRPLAQASNFSDSSSDILSRANSNASTASSASTASTAPSSVFSHSSSLSATTRSASEISYTQKPNVSYGYKYEPPTLSTLPLSILEQIMCYTLCLPLTVSIGPQNSENRHMQYRYNRAGLDYIDIQLILKHPMFTVSHQMREIALDVFYRKCDFVVDLHRIYHTRVASTVNDNLKKHQKFWIRNPPKMVRDSLRSLSRLHLRLPVPSCDSGSHRGRDEDDWMDGSDGNGGGAWRIRSLKKEQDDAARVQACVEAIMGLVSASPESEPESRGRSSSLSRTGSLRQRSLSRFRSRSRSRSRQAPSRSSSRQDDRNPDGKRQLKRMEIVLVKRNSYVTILPEVLALIKTLRSTPVTGFTKYYFELDEQKFAWATKYRKRWQGFEPDGERLLNDLDSLAVAPKPIDPISTPTEFEFVNVSRHGRLRFADPVISRAPVTLERKPSVNKPTRNIDENGSPAQAMRRKPLPWGWKKHHKAKDSFTLIQDEGANKPNSDGTTPDRIGPPTVDELKRIAEDIRNGLY